MAKKWRCTVCGYIHEGPEAPDQCPMCKVGKEKFVEVEEKAGGLDFVTEHKLGDGKGASQELWEGLNNHFMGECSEVGQYLAMARQADREGYPEIAEAFKRYAWEEAEHASKFAKTNPALGLVATFAKVGFGALCFFFLAGTSIAVATLYTGYYFGASWAAEAFASPAFVNFMFAMRFLPLVTAIGCAFLVMWADPDPRNASRGAMDNASGCAISYAVTKYFKENPDKMPKNCRIIDFNCGSEEAGLRGSLAFTRAHKGEAILENAWNINLDSVADKDYFEVVIKDDWQFCRFDKDLETMFKDTFSELGIQSKSNGCIHNPVGGCDSTPMTKAGMKSVTFAAQDPTLTYYYHTWHDMPERFSVDTVGDGFDVVLGVIDKIDKFQQANGFTGPRP